MEKTMRRHFAEQFSKLFKGKRLLAVQLDGFTHRVIFDDGTKESKIQTETYSAYLGVCDSYDRNNTNTDRIKVFFMGYPNYAFQNNAQEIVYVAPNKR
jgi:hypothetical protein